ncbi:ABC-type multidrug transport system ATPase subunit [Nocardiopsis arvandica]|uniref:ABC-type multidrug transport system ATPase subunit n=1 Tax=Nocardiopsis sinuspersici TaxID=501010 RepID=A0A7Y9XH06_9ACTN|nr:ABC-type multidrug transport system ATPase subunit [Nocardiopsis sinuspersici]
MTIIEVKDLVKHYRRVEAVNGVSFTVARGEVFGLLGRNGAGDGRSCRARRSRTP